MDSLNEAREVGFKDLDENNHEWDRVGQIENYTQIDSYGYLVHQWTKYVKFGAQRVADIACRLAREVFNSVIRLFYSPIQMIIFVI